MPPTASDSEPALDGRHARRQRSRLAVIDAMFELIHEGHVPPSGEQLAERSGISISSIFRMFDGLDDLRSQAFQQFQTRYAHLLEPDFDTNAALTERIAAFVRARTELYSAAGPLMEVANQRGSDRGPMAAHVAANRTTLAEQVRRCFAPELDGQTPTEAANLAAAIDASTSREAYQVMSTSHARTRRQIERTWRRSLATLIEAW